MSEENCSHDCSSCGESCSSRTEPQDFLAKPNPQSKIDRVIGVVSGKGGVGKSLVTSLLAVQLNRRGYHTGVLDADVTGPSIPKVFGIHQHAMGNENGIVPVKTRTGIDVISVNLLLEDENAPVVWRGPIIANVVKQFWTDVVWKDVNYLFVDMPPGTGDVPLTVFQSIPLDGIVIVTSPQELVSMIVSKAVSMAKMMNIPILGIVENMSYVKCPDCGKEITVFGESHLEQTAQKFGLKVLGRCPLDPKVSAECDAGNAEDIEAPWLSDAADEVERLTKG
ncbi:Mrp/NBP35 family ATP-binding protein [Caproicibacter fermentans]|uniref:Iron-sulfur cluster carrier protein n=1 Tax=Caproicibacter fermentans TaxID=2576756 RepID=A0A7G8TDF7_9FIRM|nr:Mrp/NBP35 family ATP-binding protein [Caproicibacter fermentans]QNK41648.1 Mrp/NBP35 family ATP-binding protein [Caproicibacter fermentans]